MDDQERDEMLKDTHKLVIRIDERQLALAGHVSDHEDRLQSLEKPSEPPIAMIRIPRVKVPPKVAAALTALLVFAVCNALGIDVTKVAQAFGLGP